MRPFTLLRRCQSEGFSPALKHSLHQSGLVLGVGSSLFWLPGNVGRLMALTLTRGWSSASSWLLWAEVHDALGAMGRSARSSRIAGSFFYLSNCRWAPTIGQLIQAIALQEKRDKMQISLNELKAFHFQALGRPEVALQRKKAPKPKFRSP
jgi:hypothetical protein